jgi:5'-nucleotidase
MEPIQISIFHTNDMHGRLEAMSRLSSFARRLRAEAEAKGRLVFFWDAGDAEDRRVKFCSISKGVAFQPIMNAMGYTLATMGNSVSLPYGPQAMAAVADRANFPILAANCRDGAGPLLVEGLRTHVVIPLPGGLQMGVIGLTAPWGTLYEIFGLYLPDFIGVARDLVAELREQGIPLIVFLSHLGLEDDCRLLDAVPGIDLIVGGHSHDRLPHGEEKDGVLIAQAGQYGEALGIVELALSPETGEILDGSARVLEVPKDEPPDPLVQEAIEAAEREVSVLLARPIGELQEALDLDHFHECGIGNFVADVLCERMDAEIAMVCSGQFHQGLPAGVITLGQLDAACFSSANPGVTKVSGAQIVAALERGLDPTIAEHLHHGFRGTPIGIPQIGGMVVKCDMEEAVGQRVRSVFVQGQPLDPNRIYRLAHTDAERMQEFGYLVLDAQGAEQTTEYEAPTILREAMEEYIQRHSPVPMPQPGRWVRV